MIKNNFRKIRTLVESKSLILPYLMTLIFLGIPLLRYFNYDFWDGSRISYADEANDFSRLNYWLHSASLEVQYIQEHVVNLISDLIEVPALFVDHLLVVLAIFVLIHEVTIIARDFLLIENRLILIPGLIVAVFPSLSLTVSSVLTFYITSLALGWYCTRKFMTSKGPSKFIALIGIIYSLQYAVLLLVCPALAFLFQATFKTRKDKRFRRNYSDLITITFVVIVYKGLQYLLNSPVGPMHGYNQIRIPNNLSEISQFAYGLKSYSSFLLYPILVVVPICLVSFTREKPETVTNSYEIRSSKANIGLLMLVISSMIPYLMVGKSTSLFWLDFWTGRHSFALIPALALLSASSLDFCVKTLGPLNSVQLKTSVILATLFISVTSCSLLERDLLSKYVQQQSREALVTTLKRAQNEIPPGFVQIVVDNSNNLEMNTDESNYLMYKVKGNISSFTQIVMKEKSETQNSKWDPEKISTRWELFEKSKQMCTTQVFVTRIDVKTQEFLDSDPKYSIKKLKSNCIGSKS